MIWQYSHVFEQPQYWLDGAAFDERMHKKELHRMAQDMALPKAALAAHGGAVRYDREFTRLAFREIARDTDERTLTFGLLPRNCGLGHTLFANAAKTYCRGPEGGVVIEEVSPLRLLFAMAWFNSVHAELAHLLRSFKGLATKRPEYLALLQ